MAGHVRGGELWAMLVALHVISVSHVRATIWCDNVAVIRKLRRLLDRPRNWKDSRTHSDLWERIRSIVSTFASDQVQVCKVIPMVILPKQEMP